uniref:Putative homeodomain-like superfamily protein n=1 Tax=Tanacetum cinerariifolium TaxID=118510 RepID=A0A6L2PCF2_TANCI|nr:putative homeodomain-like superfamily protein [Tanacetum cinerariifolium]
MTGFSSFFHDAPNNIRADDEDDLHHNIDNEEEYMKFLIAVLRDGDETSSAALENENVDEESDNDADIKLELKEALGSETSLQYKSIFSYVLT